MDIRLKKKKKNLRGCCAILLAKYLMISNVRNILETTEEVGIFFSKKREQQSPPKPAES